MPPRSLSWLVFSVFSAGLISAQATVFKGPPGGKGDVWVFAAHDKGGVQPPELQGIVLLPVDATGRSALTQFQPDQPRQIKDLPLAARVLLPQSEGSLYRFRRDRSGGADFGYFVVGHDGMARTLASFAGTGPTGSDDPIPNPVAMSASGDAMLVATTRAAGGDLFEVGFEGGNVHLLTATLPPQQTLTQGLILLPTWGAAVTNNGVLRFERDGEASWVRLEPKLKQASLGTAPQQITHFGNGLVKSADDSTVAVVAGVDDKNSHVFAFGAQGASTRVNDVPAPIADPGFGTQAAPALALSPDGRRAAWKTKDSVSGECYSRRVTLQPTPSEVHITGDQNFTDTLNDTGVIAFAGLDQVVMLVGEPNGVGGVERSDLYLADFGASPTAPAFTNLTRTSGDFAAPFLDKGDLDTSDGIFQVPGQLRFLYFVSGSSGQGTLSRLDAVTRQRDVIRNGVDTLDFVAPSGASFVAGILHDSPSQRELVEVPFDLNQPSHSIALFPSSQTLARAAANAVGVFAAIQNVTGGQRMGQLFLPTDFGGLTNPMQFGPVLGFDGAGAALFTVQAPTRTYFASWGLTTGIDFYTSGDLGLVLPGN